MKWKIKQFKSAALKNFRANFIVTVFITFVVAFLTSEGTNSVALLKQYDSKTQQASNVVNYAKRITDEEFFRVLMKDLFNGGKEPISDTTSNLIRDLKALSASTAIESVSAFAPEVSVVINAYSAGREIVQKGNIDANNMWKNEDDFKSGMYGCYYSFRAAYKVNLSYWGDFRSGVIGKGLGSFNAANHVENKLNSSEGKGTNWESLYKCINDCNVALKHLGDISWSDEGLRSQIEANCHFLRAYCYFTIARVWGDAPIMLEGIESTSH